MKKRFVSLSLVMAMLLGLCGQAFAVDTASTEETVTERVESVEATEETEQTQAEVEDEPSEEDFDKGMTSAEVAEQAGLGQKSTRRRAMARATGIGPYAFVYENGDLVFTDNPVADTTKGEVLMDGVGDINTTAYGADLKPAWNSHAKNIRRVVIEADLSPISLAYWFAGCEQLQTFVGLERLRTLNTVSLDYTFYQCYGIEEIDLSWLETDNVTSMAHTFDSMSRLKHIDVSRFDTSNVTNMEGLFRGLAELTELDISNFVTSKVQTYDYFMYGCQNITEMDVRSLSVKGMPDYICYDLSEYTGVEGLKYEWFENLIPGASANDTRRRKGTNQMFDACIRLAKIHFGKDFAFRPMTGLPTQSSNYIALADGYWFNGNAGKSTKETTANNVLYPNIYNGVGASCGPDNNAALYGNSEAGAVMYTCKVYNGRPSEIKSRITDKMSAGRNTVLPIFEDVVMRAYTPVRIIFDPKNGNAPTIVIRDIGEKVGMLPETPTKAGATFLRWGFKPITQNDIVENTITVEAMYDDDEEARAVMYSDGTLAFQRGPRIIEGHGAVVDYFSGVEDINSVYSNNHCTLWDNVTSTGVYTPRVLNDGEGHIVRSYNYGSGMDYPGWAVYATYRIVGNELEPCLSTSIKAIEFADEIMPQNMSHWFKGGTYLLTSGDGHTVEDEAKYGFGYWDGASVMVDYGGIEFRNIQNLNLSRCKNAAEVFYNDIRQYRYSEAGINNTIEKMRPLEYEKYFDLCLWDGVEDAELMMAYSNISGDIAITENCMENVAVANSMFAGAHINGSVEIHGKALKNMTNATNMFYRARVNGDITWKDRVWRSGRKCKLDGLFLGCSVIGDARLSGWVFEPAGISYNTSDNYMYKGTLSMAVSGELDVSKWDLGDIVRLENIFEYNQSYEARHTSAQRIDMSNWTGTSGITTIDYFFQYASVEGDIDMTGTYFNSATTARYMFSHAKIGGDVITEKDIFKKLTDANYMFMEARIGSITADIFEGNTENMYMRKMLNGSYGIKSVDLASISVAGADDTTLASKTLQEIRLGPGTPKIKFPTPDPAYIQDADGFWYDSLGNKYSPDNIPEYTANVYYAITPRTVTFDPDNGDEPVSFQVPYMGNAKRPDQDPTKAGKEFIGWGADDGTLWVFTNPVTKDMTLTAKYIDRETCTAIQYSNGEVVFQRGGTTDPTKGTVVQVVTDVENQVYTNNIWTTAPQEVTKAIIQDPLLPVSTAYWFAGLENLQSVEGLDYVGTTDEDIVDPEDSLGSYMVTNTAHMFDGCTSLTYLNLGRFSTYKVTDMTGMFANMPALNTVVLGGQFEFKNGNYLPKNNAEGVWYTGENFDEYAPENIPNNVKETRTYTANIETFTVEFDTGALGTEYDSQEVKFNRRATNPGRPTRTGFTFQRWVDGADKSSSPVAFDFSTPIRKDYTIKALWTPSTGVKYTEEVWVEDLETDTYTKHSTKTLRGTAGTQVEFDIRGVEVPEHYHINTEKSNLTGEVLGDGSQALKVMLERDRHTIRFNVDGGNPIEAISGVKYQQEVELPTPTKEGFNFLYWTTAMGDPVESPLVVQRDYALIAKWTALDSVTYTVTSYYQNLEDNEYTEGTTETKTGQTNAMVIINSMAPEGFRLNNEKSTVTGNIEGDGTAHFELYFDRILYNVTFDSNGGSEIDGALKVKYGTTLTDVETPVREGYNFGGWETSIRTDENGNPIKIDIPIVVKDNWALRAVWNQAQTVTIETYEEVARIPDWRARYYESQINNVEIGSTIYMVAHKSAPEQQDSYEWTTLSDFLTEMHLQMNVERTPDWQEAAYILLKRGMQVKVYLCGDGENLDDTSRRAMNAVFSSAQGSGMLVRNDSTMLLLPSRTENFETYIKALSEVANRSVLKSVITPVPYTVSGEVTPSKISEEVVDSLKYLGRRGDFRGVTFTQVSEPETLGFLVAGLRAKAAGKPTYGTVLANNRDGFTKQFIREPAEVQMVQTMYWEPIIRATESYSGGNGDEYNGKRLNVIPVIEVPYESGVRLVAGGVPGEEPQRYIKVSSETVEIPVGQTEYVINAESLTSLEWTGFHYNLEKSVLTGKNGDTLRVYKDTDKSKLVLQNKIEYAGVDLEQAQDYYEDYKSTGGVTNPNGGTLIVTTVEVDDPVSLFGEDGVRGELTSHGFYKHIVNKQEILAREVDDANLKKYGIKISDHAWDMLEAAMTGHESLFGKLSEHSTEGIATLIIVPAKDGRACRADLRLRASRTGVYVIDSECVGAKDLITMVNGGGLGSNTPAYSLVPLWLSDTAEEGMNIRTMEDWQRRSDQYLGYKSEYNQMGGSEALNFRWRFNAKDTELAELAQIFEEKWLQSSGKPVIGYELKNRFLDVDYYKQFTSDQQESLRQGRKSIPLVWNPDNTVTLGIPKARTLGEATTEEIIYVEPSYKKGKTISLSATEMGWGLPGYTVVTDDRYQQNVYSYISDEVGNLWLPLLYKKAGPILTKDYGAPGKYSVRYSQNGDLGFRAPSQGQPEGMEFKGWTYVNTDGSLGDKVSVTEGATGRNEPYHITGLKKNTTIKAVYGAPMVNVHYNVNGADTPSEGWELETSVGSPIMSPNVPVTREGYNLSHWSAVEKRPDGDHEYEIWQFGQLARYDTYLKAEWIPTHEKTAEYSINVYKQGLDTEVYELSATVTAVGIVGSTVSPTMRAPIGFHDSETADETGRTGVVTEDGKLKLAYYFDRNEYDVTFVNGSTSETKKYKYGSMVDREVPTQDGKEFVGWQVVEEDETDKTDGTETGEPEEVRIQPIPFVATGNIKLQAVWKGVTCNIDWELSEADNGQTILESGGPSGAGLPTEIEWGQAIAEPTVAPVKEGYGFTGWVDKNGELVDWTQPITGPVVIKPAFEKLIYTITWEIDEADNADTVSGTGGPGGGNLVSTVGHGDVLARPIVDPTKEGKDFTGWVYSTDGETWAPVTWTKPITQAVTIKPNFADKPVVPSNPGGNGGGGGGGSTPTRYWTVSFIGINGEEITSIRVKDREAVSIDEALENYITEAESIKWYVMEEGRTGDDLQEFKFSYRVKSDMTVRAYTVGSDEGKKPEGSNFEKNVYDYLNTQDHIAYLIGTDEGLIKPEGGITRAEVAMIMYRLLNTATFDEYYTSMNEFVDVGPEDWFNNAVSTLCNMGIIKGRGDGVFDPNAQITRAEFAAIISRLQPNSNKTMRDFNDVSKEHWAYNEIMTVAENGWTTAGDEEFRPDIGITRAEVARFMNRVLRRNNVLASGLIDGAHGAKTWADNNDVMAWYYIDMQEASNSHTHEFQDGVCVWTGLSGIVPMS